MKLFKDASLTQEITEDTLIDFGEVEAGSHKELIIYIHNDTEADLKNIDIDLPEKDKVEVTKKPITITPQKTDTMTLKWAPGYDFKRALDSTIKITAKELYA